MLENLLSRLGQSVLGTVSIDALGERPRYRVQSFNNANCPDLHRRGIYAWYSDAPGLELLGKAGLQVGSELVYVGMTSKSFEKRVLRDHIISTSNLHRTLTCVIADVSPTRVGSGIKEFMSEHFEVAVMPMRARISSAERRLIARISSAERRLIKKAEPCLNRTGLDNANTKRIGELCGKRTKLGWFRLEFWAHVARRHPDEAPPGWAGANVYHPVEVAGRRVSQYIAKDGVGVFFPRNRSESASARAAAVKSSVAWLRKELHDPELSDNGWSFLKSNPRDTRNWDSMADWLRDRRLLYERAPRATAGARWCKR